jgi:alkylation response protein AidB-like acyl-CoA dehydrogenase
MTSTLEPASREMLDVVESIRPVIERNIERSEADLRLPPEVIDAILNAGLFRTWVPKDLGGLEADFKSGMRMIEAITRIYGSAGWVFANMTAATGQTAFMSPETRAEMLTDPRGFVNAGSVASLGRAVPDGDGFRLSGQWRLASGCHHAKWFGGAALIFDGEAPRMGPGGMPDLKLMFIRPEESEILDTWNPLGMKGTGSTDFRLDNVYIPGHRMFSVLTAPPQSGGPMYQAGVLVMFSLALAAVFPGIAQAGIDAFIALAGGKTPTMSQTTLGSRPTVHAELARAVTLVQSARAYLYELADELMESLQSGAGVTEELEIKRRLACVNVAESCIRAVNMVFTLAGTTPIQAGHPLERCMRDIRTAGQHFLVSPAWLEKTGQAYFGHGLAMP